MAQRTELVRTLFGSDPFDSGAIARGIGFVPEDRHREGLMLDMTVTETLQWGCLTGSAAAPC
jgi:ABC-type sugar transport system ATPase subunit